MMIHIKVNEALIQGCLLLKFNCFTLSIKVHNFSFAASQALSFLLGIHLTSQPEALYILKLRPLNLFYVISVRKLLRISILQQDNSFVSWKELIHQSLSCEKLFPSSTLFLRMQTTLHISLSSFTNSLVEKQDC